jgi:peptidoglycan/xylan/chitin deacetylase (PgdA/CDA1 family)
MSDLALRNTRLTRQLRKAGEVGSHTENHHLLGGTKAERQRERLALTQHDLTDILGEKVNGLRPPEEQFDEATMRAWLAAGGTYMLGANDSRSASPEMLSVGRDTLVLLPRTGDDDFGVLSPGRSQDPVATAALLQGEFDWIRALGGLYALSYHSQLLSRPEHLPALAHLARSIAADTTVWIATASEIANWWRARAQLQTSARMVNPTRLELTVRNRGTTLVRGSVVRIAQPSSLDASAVSGRFGVKLLASNPGVTRVLIPFLAAGDSRVISVALGTAKPAISPRR